MLFSYCLPIFALVMKLKRIDPNNLDKNLKATAHKTGKLGFSSEAAKKMRLETAKTAYLFLNSDDVDDRNLYVQIDYDKVNENDGFKILKAGSYYYLNAKAFFDTYKLDYVNDNLVYDITHEVFDDYGDVWIFKRRTLGKEELKRLLN